jgi:hypothetical protein
MDQHSDAAHDGALMRLVADELAVRGLRVRYPEREDERRLTITGLEGIRCELLVGDSGDVEWECSPRASDEADPKQIADVATSLLTGHAIGRAQGLIPPEDLRPAQRGFLRIDAVPVTMTSYGLSA